MSNDLSESYIKLPNDIYDNVNITNEELTVLTLMYRNYMQYKSIGICSVQVIADYMRVDTSNNRKIITRIKDSIKGLIDKGYIINLYDLYYYEMSFEDATDNKYTMFYVDMIEPPENNYFVIYDRDVNHIFELLHSENISKFNIMRYFIACMRVSNNDSSFGYLTQGKLKQLVNDSRTIQRYNKILQDELHLIIYNNSYLTEDKHYCTTFIGRYDDEKSFTQCLQFEVIERKLIHTDKIKSNERRRIQQKVNSIEKSADEIRNERIAELESLLEQKAKLEYKDEFEEVVEPKHKGKGLQNKKKVIETDDSEFIEEMGWEPEPEEDVDFSKFMDWDEEDELLK